RHERERTPLLGPAGPSSAVNINQSRIGRARFLRKIEVDLRVPVIRRQVSYVGNDPILVLQLGGERASLRKLCPGRRNKTSAKRRSQQERLSICDSHGYI